MIYLKGTTLHKCLIRLPDRHSQENVFSLVVGLHGGGSHPENMIHLWDHIPGRSFIYTVPQAPFPFVQNQELVFDWGMWPSKNEELIRKASQVAEEYILNVIHQLTSAYQINNTYLMGFSQGAIFSYLTGIKNPQLFDGLICMSGPGLLSPLKNPFVRSMGSEWLPEKFIEKANTLRVLITHGKNDPAAHHELGLQSRDVLEKHGYDVSFYDFEGGHTHPPTQLLETVAEWITAGK